MDAPGKFYPAPAYIAEIDVNQLSAEISDNTTLTPTEVVGVIKSLLQTVPKYLLLGYKVRLDSFGIFKLGLKKKDSFKGWDKATEVTANDIDSLKINFTPDVMLDQKLSKPAYVKLDSKYLIDEDAEDINKESTPAQSNGTGENPDSGD